MVEKANLDERLAFLSFTEDDRRTLEALRPLLVEHADRLVAGFYRHLLSFEPMRALLKDDDVKESLIGKQREYLLSLAGPSPDRGYIEERVRIGHAHERIGLDPRWYLGAYALHFSLLVPLIAERFREDPVHLERALAALVKLLMLDAQLAMEAYIERREQELEYANRELAAASRALERDFKEADAALRQTTRRARAAEELASVATLVAGLAHEIGTPMNVIQGHTELLESAVPDERARARLQTIREQIERISNLIQTLLNISRPREPVYVPLELDEILDDTLSFVREKLRRRGIAVEREFERAPAIRADREKLQQLFLNLFLNAADAMPGGGTLTVRLAPDGRDAVEVRVGDTGEGIPRDELSRIFDAFYTSKPAGQGSGLGLVVAQGIVLDHGGDIDVTSHPGEGTEFRIRLPVGTDQLELSSGT